MTLEEKLVIRRAMNADEIIRKIRSINLSGDKRRSHENTEKGKHMLWGD